jgi:hypothetical protein
MSTTRRLDRDSLTTAIAPALTMLSSPQAGPDHRGEISPARRSVDAMDITEFEAELRRDGFRPV